MRINIERIVSNDTNWKGFLRRGSELPVEMNQQKLAGCSNRDKAKGGG